MRLLLITDKFAPERGGSQRFLAEAYRRLEGHQVTVLTRTASGAADWDAGYPHRVIRVRVPQIPKLRALLLARKLRNALSRLTRGEAFDQIHCGQLIETAPWVAAWAGRRGLPLLVHTYGEEVRLQARRGWMPPGIRRALQRAAVITTVSRYTLRELVGLGVASERVHLVYPGVDPARWDGPCPAEPSGHSFEGRRVVLTLTRLIPRKGIDTLLRAMPRVLQAVPDAACVVAGEGPDEARLRNLATRLGLQTPQVQFAGAVPEAELAAWYRLARVFAMPNREMPDGDIEGFGQVFLEANACGVPVIGGRSGGAVDAIEDGVTGYLVNPDSPDEMATRLIELLTQPELARRLGSAGRARVGASFTWDESARCLQGAIHAAAGTVHG